RDNVDRAPDRALPVPEEVTETAPGRNSVQSMRQSSRRTRRSRGWHPNGIFSSNCSFAAINAPALFKSPLTYTFLANSLRSLNADFRGRKFVNHLTNVPR